LNGSFDIFHICGHFPVKPIGSSVTWLPACRRIRLDPRAAFSRH
jgi:hypothetical protein